MTFQLEQKALERIEADKQAEAHRLFIEEIQRQAAIREPIAFVEVDLGPNSPIPKAMAPEETSTTSIPCLRNWLICLHKEESCPVRGRILASAIWLEPNFTTIRLIGL